MKLTKFLNIIILSLLLGACSIDDTYKGPDPHEGYLKVDYIIDTESSKALTIAEDHSIYTISVGLSGDNSTILSLKKISPTGQISALNNKLTDYFGGFMGLSSSLSGNLYWVTDLPQIGGSIYSCTEEDNYNLIKNYKMKLINSPLAKSPRLTKICNMGDDSFVVFDKTNYSLKRYIPELNTDILIAGSEKPGIVDGSGVNASFSFVSRILVQDGVIYVLDQGNIRKIEGTEVTTVIVDNIDEIIDIAMDSHQDIYALVSNQGIQKLTKGSNILQPYKSNILNITDGKRSIIDFDFKRSGEIYIKGNDLYLAYGSDTLIKISDFKNKL